MTTLRQLHEELNITQRLSLYIKNQNKKYKPNAPLTADDELTRTMETLIRVNTLGKLGRHKEQAQLLHDWSIKATNAKLALAYSDNEALALKLKDAEHKSKRAEKIVDNINIRDYIIKLYRVGLAFAQNKNVTEEMESVARKYTNKGYDFLNKADLYKIIVAEASNLEKFLAEKEA
nr:MAG TPA: hypothetical protein [Caudoviricetes sp.]